MYVVRLVVPQRLREAVGRREIHATTGSRTLAVAKVIASGLLTHWRRPYTPQTNGKAERFIQTCLREWAYGRLWHNSAERTSWLPAFLDYYNNRRAHSALGFRPPASRLGGNNLLTINI